jgi:hypothetical protein
MRSLGFSRCALSICVAAAMLGGCGVLRQAQDDTQPPIGVPSATSASGGDGRYYGAGGGGEGAAGFSSQSGAGGGGGRGSSYVASTAIKSREWRGWKNGTGNGVLTLRY